MESIDPSTGQALPEDAIQRVLFIALPVHVYNIPPMTPGKGHVAASWTADGNKREIFTARLRVMETSIPQPDGSEKMKTDIVLEDSSSGQLFAAAPYTNKAVVESVSDSSRFFALRVQDESGRKATLGVGFEERSEAFDFSVALQEAQKSLGWDDGGAASGKRPGALERKESSEKRDLSLKEGETITVNLKGKFGRRPPAAPGPSNVNLQSFSLPPPPSAGGSSSGSVFLPPPPSARDNSAQQKTAKDLGFDDGQFGEFA